MQTQCGLYNVSQYSDASCTSLQEYPTPNPVNVPLNLLPAYQARRRPGPSRETYPKAMPAAFADCRVFCRAVLAGGPALAITQYLQPNLYQSHARPHGRYQRGSELREMRQGPPTERVGSDTCQLLAEPVPKRPIQVHGEPRSGEGPRSGYQLARGQRALALHGMQWHVVRGIVLRRRNAVRGGAGAARIV